MSSSHLSRLFPGGDGGSGYADYLRAADLVDNDELRALFGGKKKSGPDWKRLFRIAHPSMDRRKMVIQFKQVPELIVEGNRKPLRSPYADSHVTSDFPEISLIREAGKVLDVAGAVAFEDFEPKKGVRLLTELLEYGERIARDTVLHLIVGQSLQSMALTSFSHHLEAVPTEDREALIERIKDLLKRPTIAQALQGESRFMRGYAPIGIQLTEPSERDVPSDREAKRKIEAATAEVREQTAAKVIEISDKVTLELAEIVGGPEVEWIERLSKENLRIWNRIFVQPLAPDDHTPDEIARAVMRGNVERWLDMLAAPIRTRARLRMLALSLRVDDYQRKNGAAPPSLELIRDPELTVDCITGRAFAYKPQRRGFSLWSEGIAATKPFGLDNYPPS